MVDFTITDNGWELGEQSPLKDVTQMTGDIVPCISDPKAWEQYSDFDLYSIEVLLREWIGQMSNVKSWNSYCKNRRYTMKMVFPFVFGEEYDYKKHARYTNKFGKLLAYYSTRVQKSGYIDGKTRTKTIYTLSAKRLEKPPYSLRLRLEWYSEQGVLPTAANMKLPKDLKPGHARNPRTEKNMELRREKGREIYRNWKATRESSEENKLD